MGAGLARDSGVSGSGYFDCQAAIAGKPGSHRVLQCFEYNVYNLGLSSGGLVLSTPGTCKLPSTTWLPSNCGWVTQVRMS